MYGHTTRPSSRSAASTYWTRAGLRYTRVKRTHITNQMKRVQRGRCAASTCCRATLHDLPDQPQCGLHLLEPSRSPLYTQAPSCVKRTHAANQMKRVQRVEDSLAQSGARPQCGFHISPQRTPRGKHGKANMITQKRTHAAPPPSPASPRAPVGIAARKRTNDDHDPRRNRNATYRKPSCLALTRQTAGVIEHKTPRENRKGRRDRVQDIPREPHRPAEQPPRAQSPLPEL